MDVAMVNVQAPEDEEILRPDNPDVAKEPANHKLRSADRSPPPARAKPEVMLRVLETGVIESVRVLSADRSPPPVMKPEVLMARVEDTGVIPSVIVRSADKSPPPNM